MNLKLSSPTTLHTATQPPARRTSLRGFIDPALVASSGRSIVARIVTGIVIVALAVLDAVLMRPVIALVLDETDTYATVLAFGVALAAGTAMFIAGRLNAGAIGRGRKGALVGWVLIAVWLLGGLVIATLRAKGASTELELSATTSASEPPLTTTSLLQSAMFLIVYVIIGTLAYVDAKEDRNDVFEARLITVSAVEPARARVAQLDGIAAYVAAERARACMWVDELSARLATQYAASAGLADLGAQHARLVIAAHGKDPAWTGMTSARHDDNPLNRLADTSIES
jgi:hypothetical protein